MKPETIYIATRLGSKAGVAYRADPIDYLYNLRQSLKAAAEVWRKGHYPYIPGLDFMLYMEMDGDYGLGGRSPYVAGLEWLRRCDSVLIYNGLEDSPGVQNEVEEAKRVGLKIYGSLEEIEPIDEWIIE